MTKLLLTIIAVLCIHSKIYAEKDYKYVNEGDTRTRFNSVVKMYNRYRNTKDEKEINSLILAMQSFLKYSRSHLNDRKPNDINANQYNTLLKQFRKKLYNAYERRRQIRQIKKAHIKLEKARVKYKHQQKEIKEQKEIEEQKKLKQKTENEKRITEYNRRKKELELRKAQSEWKQEFEEKSRIAKVYETLSKKYKMNGIAYGGLKKFLINMIEGEDVSGYKNKLFIDSNNLNRKFKAFSRGQGITLYAGGKVIIAVKGKRLIPNNARLTNNPMIYIGLYEYKTTVGGSNVVPAFVIAE
jgi:hypothetical protein